MELEPAAVWDPDIESFQVYFLFFWEFSGDNEAGISEQVDEPTERVQARD